MIDLLTGRRMASVGLDLATGRSACIVVSDDFEAICAMRISIVALEGLFDTGLTGIFDVLSTANSLSAAMTGVATRFDLSVSRQRLEALLRPRWRQLDETVNVLIEEELTAGGPDNISLTLIGAA